MAQGISNGTEKIIQESKK